MIPPDAAGAPIGTLNNRPFLYHPQR